MEQIDIHFICESILYKYQLKRFLSIFSRYPQIPSFYFAVISIVSSCKNCRPLYLYCISETENEGMWSLLMKSNTLCRYTICIVVVVGWSLLKFSTVTKLVQETINVVANISQTKSAIEVNFSSTIQRPIKQSHQQRNRYHFMLHCNSSTCPCAPPDINMTGSDIVQTLDVQVLA